MENSIPSSRTEFCPAKRPPAGVAISAPVARSAERIHAVPAVILISSLMCLPAGCQPDSPPRHAPQAADTHNQVVNASPSETNPTTQAETPEHFAADRAVSGSIVRWVSVPDLPKRLAILESVFWEPDDTTSLRQLIRDEALVHGKRVLEVGTGSGLISLCCLQAGASHVVATDINPQAVENARFNARELQLDARLQVRLVPLRAPSAWTVLLPGETFDVIISNPPWENQKPVTVAEFALYDPDFALLQSLLQGARQRLNPGGRMLLAYGCVTAIRRIQDVAAQEQLSVRILDNRDLNQLPEVFLPGMLIELRPDDRAATPADPPTGGERSLPKSP
jgi:release factor glutamine methyltransferase